MRFKILPALLLGNLALLFGNATALFAQNFVFPTLNKTSKTIEGIIPSRWVAIDTAYGDLNNDAQDDLALILEYHTQVKEKRAYGDNTTELITELQKPRILAVYFKSKNSKNYILSMQNNDFILREAEGGAMGNPLRPLQIAANKIVLNFEGGSGWRWKLNYGFTYQNNKWYLAEAGNLSYHNGTGDMTQRQYNFLTKKQTVVTGNLFERTAASTSTEQALDIKTLRTFDTFKKPWTWEIKPNEFL